MRNREIFEAGPEGPARELSKDEILERDIRTKLCEMSKGEWVQRLLKSSGMSEEEWLDKRVIEEMEKIKSIDANREHDDIDK